MREQLPELEADGVPALPVRRRFRIYK